MLDNGDDEDLNSIAIPNDTQQNEEEEDDAFEYTETTTGLESSNASGDYASQLSDLLGSDKEESPDEDEDEDEDEGFVYAGADAEEQDEKYGARLRDVMGSEHDSEEAHEVERSLLSITIEEDEVLPDAHNVDDDPSEPTSSLPATPPRTFSPALPNSNLNTPSKLIARPFLHPHVSRLRSFTPQSNASSASVPGTPSHMSAISRVSSMSNLQEESSQSNNNPRGPLSRREIFRWSPLRNIMQHLYTSAAHRKVASVLGSDTPGIPTVLAANGLICVGTQQGRIAVYDFKQTLKGVCGSADDVKELGPVTALALSHDHTFVAAGHATGHIRLFDLKNPATPARFVPPTTLAIIASGRKEGHLRGSRITSIAFIAGRHTAIVSADDHGLAFYHSLGKVLFVDAIDTLRILGKYPLDDPPLPTPQSSIVSPDPARRRARYTILAMAPLPLGTSPHLTDSYNIVGLLTPTKLVVVGLKPSPKTWFKCTRPDDAKSTGSRWRGTMAWFPSVKPSTDSSTLVNGSAGEGGQSTPTLAYSWGNQLHLIRVTETKALRMINSNRNCKPSEVEIGNITHVDIGKWTAESGDILSLQWLNVNQILIMTATTLEAFDVNLLKSIEKVSFDSLSLTSPPPPPHEDIPSHESVDPKSNIAHSVRTYKGKIFILGRSSVQVGTLLTWADRILSFVQVGDFLSAIELTRSYYLGTASGNMNGLPDDLPSRKEVIGKKMRDLMVASANYAFSEDRMTDDTHITPDGRGVDRTSLFEGLVSTCCSACVALDDTDFLFEDLFQYYEDNGIASIFLRQLEPFVLDNDIRFVPPRITKRLIGLHDGEGRSDLIERVIWHIDPLCLDIDQAISLCEQHHLYDALIYVYTRALKDYVAPVVVLLGLIRRIFQLRGGEDTNLDEDQMESLIISAYKIYGYLSNVLSGLEYPSEHPLDADEAKMAKKTVYTFLFFGRSSIWPSGDGGKLVFTADEDGGMEPTYPYARQLLRFDAETFLNSLDISFEDAYLNDNTQSASRSLIIRILLEIVASDNFPSADVTFVNIFIARNVPKYPQFLQDISPSTLHNVLISLAEDPDPNTKEDRQLAAEFLLSVYNPHESERIVALFQEAGFYRILRAWHRQEKRWGLLLATYLDDTDVQTPELFEHLTEVLQTSSRASKGQPPFEVIQLLSDSLPQLLQSSVSGTATLVDSHVPGLHQAAIEAFGDSAERKQFHYLRHLLGPDTLSEDEYHLVQSRDSPSANIPNNLRQLYISLHCKYRPSEVIPSLKYLPPNFVSMQDVLETCQQYQVYDAVVWVIDCAGDPREALRKLDTFEKQLTLKVVEDIASFSGTSFSGSPLQLDEQIRSLESLGRAGVAICMERSRELSPEVPLEDIWFQLLSSQINCVQNVSICCAPEVLEADSPSILEDEEQVAMWTSLSSLRSLVRETFGALVSITSTRIVSFPSLFARLVDSVPRSSSETQYAEFRTILTGMLESYRSDGDMLIIAKRLIDRDLFEVVSDVTKERSRGWRPSRSICAVCRKPLLAIVQKPGEQLICVSRSGAIYHRACT